MGQDREALLKAHVITVANASGETTQPLDDDEMLGTPDDCIVPPVPPESLAKLSQINSVRKSVIDAIARNTVGLGYELDLDDGFEHEVPDPTQSARDAMNQLEGLASRDLRLTRPSFTDLLYAVKTDEEEVGSGYIEVSRDQQTGQINGLFHAPGKRMRRRRDRKGWVLLSPDGMNRTPFYNFGEKVNYTREGRPLKKLQAGKRWATNEIIPFQLYTSESRDYGLPRDVAMTLEYLGDKLAAETNVSFFDSSGVPPTILFIQGKEEQEGGRITFKVPQETVERIQSTLKSDGGHGKRVAIVPLPPGVEAQAEAIGTVPERDMGFVHFRADNRGRTLGAFRVSPIFISDTGDAGRYTSEVQRAITLEQVFDPEQQRYERRLSNYLLTELGFAHLKLKFKRLAVEDNAARRDSADKMAEAGTITRREHRKAHGFGPLPEAAKSETKIKWGPDDKEYKSAEPGPGQVPYGWNDEVIFVGQPKGAENRVVTGTEQTGQKPGIGGRSSQSKDEPSQAQPDKQPLAVVQ